MQLTFSYDNDVDSRKDIHNYPKIQKVGTVIGFRTGGSSEAETYFQFIETLIVLWSFYDLKNIAVIL